MKTTVLFLLSGVLSLAASNQAKSQAILLHDSPSASAVNRAVLLAHGVTFNEDSTCRTTNDPYEFPARVFAGPNPERARRWRNGDRPIYWSTNMPPDGNPADEGRCIVSPYFRPAIPMKKQDIEVFSLRLQANEVAIANVRDRDGFSIAVVNPAEISELIFQVAEADVPILGRVGAHAQVRLKLRAGHAARLYRQWPFAKDPYRTTDELFFTVQGAGARNVTEGREITPDFVLNTLDGSLHLMLAVQTKEFRVLDTYSWWKNLSVAQYRMHLSQAEMTRYVHEFLRISSQRRLGRHYLLTARNCASEQFRALDAATGRPFGIGTRWPPWTDGTVYPGKNTEALLERNLIHDLKEDFIGYFEDEPATRTILVNNNLR